MNICGLNFYYGEKGNRVNNQLSKIKKIFDSDSKNNFIIQNDINTIKDCEHDFFVTCGDIKISFDKNLMKKYNDLKLINKPQLVRDVTYLRVIPKIKDLDVNYFPRLTWNSILPDKNNFPYDKSYNRWLDLKKKYNLIVNDYKKQGDNLLFLLQIPTDASLNELNFKMDGYLNFMIRTITNIFKYSDRKIILRSHPLIKNRDFVANYLINHFSKTKKIFLSKKDSLYDDLNNIKCVISYNSSATVEALFYGINVINLSHKQPCFSAASNNLSDIENLNELCRKDFLKKIAFLHWENDEFESTDISRYICSLLEKSIQRRMD